MLFHKEFFVESIIDMKGDSNRIISLEILVKWLNYDNKHNTSGNNQYLHDNE